MPEASHYTEAIGPDVIFCAVPHKLSFKVLKERAKEPREDVKP